LLRAGFGGADVEVTLFDRNDRLLSCAALANGGQIRD